MPDGRCRPPCPSRRRVMPLQRRWRRFLAAKEDMILWLARPGAALAVRLRLRAGHRAAITLAAKALPNLVVAGVMPAVCFLAGRRLWGLAGGICLALAWNGACQVVRRLLGKPLSGLLIIALLELVLRASVALALKSTQAFFIAPAIVTAVTGVVYIGSGFTSTPLVGKVLADLVPASVLDVTDPRVAVLLRKGSLLYGAEQLLIAVVSLVMILNLSTTVYVAVHSLVSWVLLGLVAALIAPFLLAELRAAIRQDRPILVGAS